MSTARLLLLDTNIVSHLMREANGVAAQRLQAASQAGATPVLSIVVQCELLYGVRKKSSRWLQEAYDLQMARLPVLPLDDSVPPHYATLRGHLESRGQPIGPNDALIAAHALALGATLVSGDDEFARVPGLKVENWLRPFDTPST